MVSKERIEWGIDNLLAYIDANPGKNEVHLRKLHYFVLAHKLGNKMVPRREAGAIVFDEYGTQRINNQGRHKGKMTKINWYQAILCGALKDARLKHMVDLNLIIDEKNDKIVLGLHSYENGDKDASVQDLFRAGKQLNGRRKEADVREITYETPTGDDIYIWTSNMKDWDTFKDRVGIDIDYQEERFWNSDYHLVVGIEKSGYEKEIEAICRKHGADFMNFSGQPSVTSECIIYQLAKMDDKPVMLFYIVDLDPAGYQMPYAFIKNLNKLFPEKEHKLNIVGLTFEQATELQLPASFDLFKEKDYGRAKIETFYKHTGMDDTNRIAIELNALDDDYIMDLLEDALAEYSGIDIDEDRNREFRDEIDPIKDKTMDELDLDDFEFDYQNIYNDYQELAKEVKEFKDGIANRREEIDGRIIEIKTMVQKRIEDEFNNNREDSK